MWKFTTYDGWTMDTDGCQVMSKAHMAFDHASLRSAVFLGICISSAEGSNFF